MQRQLLNYIILTMYSQRVQFCKVECFLWKVIFWWEVLNCWGKTITRNVKQTVCSLPPQLSLLWMVWQTYVLSSKPDNNNSEIMIFVCLGLSTLLNYYGIEQIANAQLWICALFRENKTWIFSEYFNHSDLFSWRWNLFVLIMLDQLSIIERN